MSHLIEFYRGISPDSEGRTLADLWALSDDEMEEAHDFIQWMFPLKEPSRFNPDAPLLADEDVSAFHDEPALREALSRSLARFLSFLGLAIEGDRVVPAADYSAKSDIWRIPDHNWLRITRVLACTRMLGLEAESRAFFAFLEDLHRPGRSGIDDRTFAFWSGTQGI